MPKKPIKRIRSFQPKLKAKAKSTISKKAIRKANKTRKRSSLELLIYKWLNDENIKFRKEKVIGRCHVDVFIEPNIVIEIQGDFWHKCPIHYPEKTKENLEVRMKDLKRFAFFRSKGYEVHTIWECQIKKDPEKIKEQLRFLSKGL